MLSAVILLLAEVVVANGYIRDVIPGRTVTAGYCDLMNETTEDIVLLAVSTPIAGSVQVHETRQVGTMMRMRHIPQLTLPASSTVRLKPLGKHLMLFDAQPGDALWVPFTFEFSDGSSVTTDFEVIPIGAIGAVKQ